MATGDQIPTYVDGAQLRNDKTEVKLRYNGKFHGVYRSAMPAPQMGDFILATVSVKEGNKPNVKFYDLTAWEPANPADYEEAKPAAGAGGGGGGDRGGNWESADERAARNRSIAMQSAQHRAVELIGNTGGLPLMRAYAYVLYADICDATADRSPEDLRELLKLVHPSQQQQPAAAPQPKRMVDMDPGEFWREAYAALHLPASNASAPKVTAALEVADLGQWTRSGRSLRGAIWCLQQLAQGATLGSAINAWDANPEQEQTHA